MSEGPEKIAPYSVEAEAGVLGSVLAEPDALYEVRGVCKLSPEMFYDPAHQAVAQAIWTLADAGRPADLVTVPAWLNDKNLIDRAGGLTRIMSLVDATPTSSHVKHYAAIVRNKWRLRGFVQVLREGLDGAYYDENIDQVFSKTANRLNDLANDQVQQQRTNVQVMDEMLARWEEAHARRQKGQEVDLPGLRTPFGRFNELTGGLQPGLHFIAAPPNAGKTCVEGQIAEYVAQTAGPVLRIYLDDTHDDAIGRSASRLGGVSLNKLQHGFATASDMAKLRDEVRPIIEAMPLYIHEDVETVEQIKTLGRLYKAKFGIVMITVDYVQIVDCETDHRGMQERDRLAEVCKGLKRLWKELRIPIVVLSQVQREGYKGETDPRTASMSDLFGGAVLEHTATTVSILKAFKSDPKDAEEKGYFPRQPLDQTGHSFKHAVAWHLVKSKHGPKGMIPLWFLPNYFRFENTRTYMKQMGKTPVRFYNTWEEDIAV